jgi:Protein of unknown function (DUF4238)
VRSPRLLNVPVRPTRKETKPIARRHHYLPQAYLTAFTNTGSKDDQCFVLDVGSGRSFRTPPKNVAAERDFNRVDIEGRSPDAIEQTLAPFEAQATKAIQSVIASEEVPNEEDCNWILNLLGLIAVRNPQLRKSFNHFHERVIDRIDDLLVSDKKIWDHHVKKAREAGESIKDDVSFRDAKRFIEERAYRVEFPPEGNLRVEVNAFDKLLPILGQRTWSVLVAPNDRPEFICSDHPVTLTWKTEKHGPVGYGLKETEVFCPLGRRVAFYGVFETPLRPIVKLKLGHVATMNTRVALNAERQVFSALESFSIWHEGQVRGVQCGSNPSVQPAPASGRS